MNTYLDLWQTLMRGEIWRGEFINQRKDGSIYPEFAIISPVRQPDGRSRISWRSRKTSPKEAQPARTGTLPAAPREPGRRAHRRTGARQGAGRIGQPRQERLPGQHEPRNPDTDERHHRLTHLIQRDLDDPEQRLRLRKVNEAAEHLMEVINDVLDISKIESGNQPRKPASPSPSWSPTPAA
jgi:two-component system sensor histidine kinase/response regulator